MVVTRRVAGRRLLASSVTPKVVTFDSSTKLMQGHHTGQGDFFVLLIWVDLLRVSDFEIFY